MGIKQLVRAAMLAELIQEESWVPNPAYNPDNPLSPGGHYANTRSFSALEAAEELNMQLDVPEEVVLSLMVRECWNEVQEWFTIYFGYPTNKPFHPKHLRKFILDSAASESPAANSSEAKSARLPDTSNVYHKDMLDPEHRWGSKDLPWIFECDENAINSLEEFATEDEACAAQRDYRRKHNYNPYNGLPND